MRNLITAVLSGVFLSGCAVTQPPPSGREAEILKEATGTYSYNFTDTDECAVVEVRFGRNSGPSHVIPWLAEGSMTDPVSGFKVEFQGAHVVVEPDGTIDVNARFVNFHIKGKELAWGSGYSHELYKE